VDIPVSLSVKNRHMNVLVPVPVLPGLEAASPLIEQKTSATGIWRKHKAI
jgi:hypothetical protein